MISPELRALTSTDLDRSGLPDDPKDCSVAIDAEIGPKGAEGSDRFSFFVVTPAALLSSPLPRWGRAILIVEEFSWVAVERAVQRLLDHSQGDTWQEVATSLNQDLNWEFNNYRPRPA